MITTYVSNLEFHYEVASPSWFQYRTSLWLADLICFLDVFYMVLAFNEPAGTVCHACEAFSRGFILLELEMIRFLPSWICSSLKNVFMFIIPIFKIWE